MTKVSAVLLAASVPDEDIGKAGPIGLFLILSLLVVVFLLGRSMRTHLRRVPLEFPDPDAPPTGKLDETMSRGEVLEGEVLEGEVIDRPHRPAGSQGVGRERPDGSQSDII